MPRAEYSRRHAAYRDQAARLATRSDRIADGRLILFALLVGLALGAYLGRISGWWLAAPAIAFVGLVFWSGRINRSRRHAERASAYYDLGLARLDDRWAGRGESGARFLDEAHPYAADLDLFGAGSLFERLCTARTAVGQATLADWLRRPAEPEEVRARQAAVAELTPKLDLREDLALLGDDVQTGVHPEELAAWGAAPPHLEADWVPPVSLALGLLVVLAGIGWYSGVVGPAPGLVLLAVNGLFALTWRRGVRESLAAVERLATELSLLAELLARLENEPMEAPRLASIKERLAGDDEPPSRQIARLARLVDRLELRENLFTAIPAGVLLTTTRTAFRIESWRAASGPSIGRWLAAAGEVEAFASLAAYAYENPADPFPELLDDGPARFDGQGLGHPLIPADSVVRNDVSLGDDLRVLVISGSNMSGKSTLLRTVGANAVLAQAGAPVRATRLVLSPLAIGATLRVQDSLQAGRSRFYAEITRVRQLVDIARGPVPLLFLLDEVFNGTNSHDRRIGAEAVVRSLLDLGALGLLTTHDLALTEIADRLAPRAANVHFEDRLVDGTMTFDYAMRPGVVQHSNALALMRAVGLEV